VQFDEPAAVDGPQKTGAAEIVERPFGRTTEQSHRVPAQSGGTLGPVFGEPQEFIAVFNELAPTCRGTSLGGRSESVDVGTIEPHSVDLVTGETKRVPKALRKKAYFLLSASLGAKATIVELAPQRLKYMTDHLFRAPASWCS
jgi:hypothetical protein